MNLEELDRVVQEIRGRSHLKREKIREGNYGDPALPGAAQEAKRYALQTLFAKAEAHHAQLEKNMGAPSRNVVDMRAVPSQPAPASRGKEAERRFNEDVDSLVKRFKLMDDARHQDRESPAYGLGGLSSLVSLRQLTGTILDEDN